MFYPVFAQVSFEVLFHEKVNKCYNETSIKLTPSEPSQVSA